MIWCFISSILFNYHKQQKRGLTASRPNGGVVILFSIVGIVGDSTYVTQNNQDETLAHFLARVKYDAQL